jgi:Tfp pilus assembly protein PilF
MYHRAPLFLLLGSLFALTACSGAVPSAPSLETAAAMAASGMLAEAEEEAGRVLAQDTHELRDAALTRRGCVRVERGNAQGAIEDLRTVPDLGLAGRTCLGKAFALIASHKRTFVVLAPLVDGGTFSPETALLAIQAAFALRHMEDARRLVHKAVQKYPEESGLLVLQAKTYALDGDIAQALNALDLAAAADATSADVPFVRGNILWALERYDEAIVAYGQALKLNPHFAEAARNLAATLIGLERFQEAADLYEEALGAVGEDPVLLSETAGLYARMGRGDRAVQMLERGIAAQLDPAETTRLTEEMDAFKLLLDNLCVKEGAVRFAAARLKKRGWNKSDVVRVLDSVLSDPIFGTLLEAKESECRK